MGVGRKNKISEYTITKYGEEFFKENKLCDMCIYNPKSKKYLLEGMGRFTESTYDKITCMVSCYKLSTYTDLTVENIFRFGLPDSRKISNKVGVKRAKELYATI